jgi:hypothetical protein
MATDQEEFTEEELRQIDEEAVRQMTPEFFAKRMVAKWKELATNLSERLKKSGLPRGGFAGKSEEEKRKLLGEETYKLLQEYLNHPLSQESSNKEESLTSES